jgi:hypothetical protein
MDKTLELAKTLGLSKIEELAGLGLLTHVLLGVVGLVALHALLSRNQNFHDLPVTATIAADRMAKEMMKRWGLE